MSDKISNCNQNHEADCGCGHDHNEHPTITLTMDDNSELECSVLGTFDVENKEYIALLPLNDDEVLIYNYKEVGDEIVLDLIESDEEFETVSEVFYTLFADEEEYEYEYEEESQEE